MTYYESAQDVSITPARARQEVEAHGADWEEFLGEMGLRAEYDAQEVLGWLGY